MKRIARDPYGQREFAIEWRDSVVDGGAAVTTAEGRGQSVGEWLRGELAAALAACGMFECVALGYLGVSGTLIIFFAQNLAHPVRLIGMQVSVVAAILILCRVEARVAAPQELGDRRGSRDRSDRQECFSYLYPEILAFLAALVSAFVFFILF